LNRARIDNGLGDLETTGRKFEEPVQKMATHRLRCTKENDLNSMSLAIMLENQIEKIEKTQKYVGSRFRVQP
jgi:hypothetical protein